MRTLATFTALAALSLTGVAPLALAGEQAGALPTNNANIDISTLTIRVEADHADEADTTPLADYAHRAGNADTSDTANRMAPIACPAEPASRGHCYDWVKDIDLEANPPSCSWRLVRLVNQCGGNPQN